MCALAGVVGKQAQKGQSLLDWWLVSEWGTPGKQVVFSWPHLPTSYTPGLCLPSSPYREVMSSPHAPQAAAPAAHLWLQDFHA